jgi:nitrate reductase NapD
MNISSVILRVLPARLPAIRAALRQLPGVDLHGDPGDGRLVLTVEDTDRSRASDVLMDLHRLEGLLSASLVYQYADPDFAPTEPHHGSH